MKRLVKRPIALIQEIQPTRPDSRGIDLRDPDGKPIGPLYVAPQGHRKEPGKRRQRVDPTTCTRDYENDDIQFMTAMDQYKRDNRRQFPTWSEVLEVLIALGYRKVAKPTPMPGLSTAMPPTTKTTG